MSSNYLNMMRRQAGRRASGFQFTAKAGLLLIALIGMGASALYWWGVQSQLTDNRAIATAFTAILVLAPPSLTSFLIPWSPAGMLLQKINARTYGYVAVIGCALFLFYYSYRLQTAWWSAQPAVADSNLVYQQVLIGIIGFIVIPALLWTPVTPDELIEQARQAHLVKRYELQTQADIAILRATLLRAQEKALIGFANLTVDEREELTGVMKGLVTGIDKTLREVGESVQRVSGAMVPFEALEDNEDVQEILDYIGGSLTSVRMVETEDGDRSVESAAPARALATTDDTIRMPQIAPAATGRQEVLLPPSAAALNERSIPSGRDGTRSAPVISADLGRSQIGGDRSIRSALAVARLGPDVSQSAPMDDDARAAMEVVPTASAALAVMGYDKIPWTTADLAKALHIEDGTARKIAAIWVERQIARRGPAKGLAKGRYQFVEVH